MIRQTTADVIEKDPRKNAKKAKKKTKVSAVNFSRSQFNKTSLWQEAVQYHVKYSLGKRFENASKKDLCKALSLTLRDQLIDGMFATEARYQKQSVKRLYYLSMEFLIGRSLENNLHNLGLFDLYSQTLAAKDIDLQKIVDHEPDAALGNGGLGRLAACFLDSLAALDMPGFGYGINYEFGLFKQKIYHGYQKEQPDQWFREESPWLIERPDDACIVPVYGRIEHHENMKGNYIPMWMDWQVIIGIPHDMPIVGYSGKTVNFLRLFSARSSDNFDMEIFNDGDYLKAVEQKMASETISKILYPSDAVAEGKELRLVQEYFLVACAIRDIVRKYLQKHKTMTRFSEKVAIQMNDTHPALSVAELMRILLDEHDLSWENAWDVTQATLGYTNHTLMPEALEKWSIPLMERVLPRHLQIIYEINHRFLQHVAVTYPNDDRRQQSMSIIEESNPKQIRMANLAIVGSHAINGVAALHSELVKTSLVPDFYQLWPERFSNKTNGVTQRRWLLQANPLLAGLLNETIGPEWISDCNALKKLEQYATNKTFQKAFLHVKHENKKRLAEIIKETNRIDVNPKSMFDIQVKRIHEYKRQLLNALHIIHQYWQIVEDAKPLTVPKTYIIAGKAAPGYYMAKLIIKFINSIASVVNKDPKVNGQLSVVFLPDYKVSLAEKIIPAADLSEQISTAGTEASGTGNMKLAMNGALTIGTLDGANVEILEEVGEENIYIFGLKTGEVEFMQQQQSYNPWDYYHGSRPIKRIMDSIVSDVFCPTEPGLFRPIFDSILPGGDKYFLLADLESFVAAQEKASGDFRTPAEWAKKAILNVARMGKFSSDRTISEYAKDIWGIKSIR
ncbi:MAG: glycogen/starch/alpha-glucan phosphorylase [bacterium]